MKNITVFGATGLLGKPVTEELVKSGFVVKALVRDIEKAKKIFPSGVSFVKGDLEDKFSLKDAMQHADGIYISIANTYKDKENGFNAEQHGLDNILEVAKELKIKQVVFLSSFLARNYQGDWWVFRGKKSSISRVKNAGLPYTIFYPSTFMENFHNGMIRGHKVAALKQPVNNKAYWIAGSDYGKMVAKAFDLSSTLNKEYSVQGPQAFTMKEAAEEFAANYSKDRLSVALTPYKLVKFLGNFVPQIKYLMKMSEVSMNNRETFESQNTWDELGAPETTIATFAKL
ncbi:NmrA family NAD(P)-binding protein [Mucilaginibacter sp. KACC 22773]|uniref:SDR family oxidoreductase n=1 Tax=Mucilaginibacter sp. KACC 22773 TaxID=3025671 RepID=UPI002365C4B1|nr:NmrA family NAD(P)-binding protein [Mucilaginibacter sp. KACC 22773]WDF77233.1 NmrA family NAD(P)-binding protein [Mucilaginibacter sp. KACC 22773]